MLDYKIHRRTFEAKKHPKGSEERKKLNMSAITSEYMTSYKYALIGKNELNEVKISLYI